MDWKSCISPEGVPTLGCITIVFSNILDWAFGLSGITALAFIIIAGYKFIFSGGDPKQVDAAKKTLTLAIAGLLVVVFSYFLLNLIAHTTGVGCITKFGFENCK